MLVATLVCWLAVIIFSATAVSRLARGWVSAKTIDLMLLPGTLLARLGEILGLLLTGGSLQGVSLIGEPRSAAPRGASAGTGNGIRALLSSIVSALLPFAACAAGIVFLVKLLGVTVARTLLTSTAATHLPVSLETFWDFLRGAVDLMESAVSGAVQCNLGDWRVWGFIYLLICFALRMTPARGDLRGMLFALAAVGTVLALAALVYAPITDTLNRGWPLVSLVVATNLLLLLVVLLARGVTEVLRALRGQPSRGTLHAQ